TYKTIYNSIIANYEEYKKVEGMPTKAELESHVRKIDNVIKSYDDYLALEARAYFTGVDYEVQLKEARGQLGIDLQNAMPAVKLAVKLSSTLTLAQPKELKMPAKLSTSGFLAKLEVLEA